MTTYLHWVFRLILLQLTYSASQSPPGLLHDTGYSQKVVKAGETVTISCSVSGDRTQMLFEWYKDKQSVISFGSNRLRITGNGSLRIKHATAEDTGIYVCRAVNGFGNVEYNATLVVLDDEENMDYEDITYTTDAEDETQFDEDEIAMRSEITKPQLLYVTKWDNSQSTKLLGSTVQLHCVAIGQPRPRIAWTKDGGNLPGIVRRGRWSLYLQNLQPSHSGNYTCTASNRAGSTSHSFSIDVTTVLQRSRGKPEMVGVHPINATIDEGHVAVLQCIVKSVLIPHIEWLKRVEPNEMDDENFRDVIQVGEENFRIVKSTDVMHRNDGSYLNKLVIPHTTKKDSGKYICLGANTNGYSYRAAVLSIRSSSSALGETLSLPFPIVVVVIVLGITAIAGTVALVVYCRNQHGSSNSSVTSSTAAVPMITKDNCVHCPLRPGSTSIKPHEATNRNRTNPQVTVYIPSCQVKYGHGLNMIS